MFFFKKIFILFFTILLTPPKKIKLEAGLSNEKSSNLGLTSILCVKELGKDFGSKMANLAQEVDVEMNVSVALDKLYTPPGSKKTR